MRRHVEMAAAQSPMDRSKREAMDIFVNEIAKGDDDGVAAAVRAAIERGYSASFAESLTEAKRKKEGEIDRICARHYNDFLSSVSEMLRMRGSANSLTTLVTGVHQDFSSAGEELINLLVELYDLQKEGEQTEKVLEQLLRCRDVASLMVQVRQQINSQEHYVAMCTIERLYAHQEALPPLPRPLALCLDKWLPAIIDQLLKATCAEADELMKKLRSQCKLIGYTILHKQALISADQMDVAGGGGGGAGGNDADAAADSFPELSESTSFAAQLLRKCAGPLRLKDWATKNDVEKCAPARSYHESKLEEDAAFVEVLPGSLGPLHKALHVAGVLNHLSTLHDHLREERWSFLVSTIDEVEKEISLIQRTEGEKDVMDAFSPLLASIAGFFVLEALIRRCVERPEGMYSWSEIIGLWDKVCIRLDVLLAKQSDTLRTPEQVLRLKDELAVLAEAVCDEALGLRPVGIQETIRLLWGKFEDLQIEAVQKDATHILETSAYQSLVIESQSDFDSQIKAYALDDLQLDVPAVPNAAAAANLDALEAEMGIDSAGAGGDDGAGDAALPAAAAKSPYPMQFPFSSLVPLAQHALFMTITRIIAFTAKSSLSTNRCDVVCSTILRVYEGVAATLGKELSKDGVDTPLTKVCQISIDAAALAAASDAVWQMLTACQRRLRWNQGRDGLMASCSTSAKSILMQVSLTAQDVIVELLGKKVNDLLESIVFIDYLPEVLPRCGCIASLLSLFLPSLLFLFSVSPPFLLSSQTPQNNQADRHARVDRRNYRLSANHVSVFGIPPSSRPRCRLLYLLQRSRSWFAEPSPFSQGSSHQCHLHGEY